MREDKIVPPGCAALNVYLKPHPSKVDFGLFAMTDDRSLDWQYYSKKYDETPVEPSQEFQTILIKKYHLHREDIIPSLRPRKPILRTAMDDLSGTIPPSG